MDSVRSCQKLPICPTEPMQPAPRWTEPVSDGGSASGITVKKGGKKSAQQQSEEKSENM